MARKAGLEVIDIQLMNIFRGDKDCARLPRDLSDDKESASKSGSSSTSYSSIKVVCNPDSATEEPAMIISLTKK